MNCKEMIKQYQKELGELAKKDIEQIEEWLNNQLEVFYIFSSGGEPAGGIIIMGTGGPHVEVNTRDKRIYCYWGGDKADGVAPFEFCNRIDEVLEELYPSLLDEWTRAPKL